MLFDGLYARKSDRRIESDRTRPVLNGRRIFAILIRTLKIDRILNQEQRYLKPGTVELKTGAGKL